MSNYPPFKTAIFDPTGFGFGYWLPGFRYYPELHISAVSYNQQEDRAYFINANGNAVPLEHNRYPLAAMLKRAVRHEFGCIAGDGQFAMKPPEYQALVKAGRLKEWVTYWFADPEPGFESDPAVYAAYRAKCVLEARKNTESFFRTAEDRYWPEELRSAKQQPEALSINREQLQEKRRAWLDLELKRCEEQAGKECDESRAAQMKLDKQIGEWLRGDVGYPPLLALMKASKA